MNTMAITVTTDCQCENYNEETDEYSPAEFCFGDCFETQKEDVFSLLGEWKLLNDIDEYDPILIETNSIGWQNRSAYKIVDFLELDSALSINSDFRIDWYLEGIELTARRWSHDEPTGTGLFTFTVLKSCDVCGEPIHPDAHNGKFGLCIDCSSNIVVVEI